MNKNVIRGLVAAGVLTVVGAANAALPDGTKLAIEAAGTDVTTAIGIVILVGIGIYAAKLLGRKMGWL